LRAYGVVVNPPLLDQHLGFSERVEHLGVQQLVAQLAVEAFHVAVLPRATRLDKGCLGTNAVDPALHGGGHELRPVVRADVSRRATDHKRRVRPQGRRPISDRVSARNRSRSRRARCWGRFVMRGMRRSAAAFRKPLILLCGGSCGGCLRRFAVVQVKPLKTRVRRSCGAWPKRAVVGVLLLRSRDKPPRPRMAGACPMTASSCLMSRARRSGPPREAFWANVVSATKAGRLKHDDVAIGQ